MRQSDQPLGLALSDQLGPLPHPMEVARVQVREGLRITHAYSTQQLRAERERCYALGVAAEQERWREVEQYLVAAADGSMSRNNSEALASELLAQILGPNVGAKPKPTAAPMPE